MNEEPKHVCTPDCPTGCPDRDDDWMPDPGEEPTEGLIAAARAVASMPAGNISGSKTSPGNKNRLPERRAAMQRLRDALDEYDKSRTPSPQTTEGLGGDLVFGNGTVQFSREKLRWDAGDVALHARRVTETAPNGGVYMRLASPIEDELLDALAARLSVPSEALAGREVTFDALVAVLRRRWDPEARQWFWATDPGPDGTHDIEAFAAAILAALPNREEAPDPTGCTVYEWCYEPDGHTGPHRPLRWPNREDAPEPPYFAGGEPITASPSGIHKDTVAGIGKATPPPPVREDAPSREGLNVDALKTAMRDVLDPTTRERVLPYAEKIAARYAAL